MYAMDKSYAIGKMSHLGVRNVSTMSEFQTRGGLATAPVSAHVASDHSAAIASSWFGEALERSAMLFIGRA
jgi:hypothetical protein